MKSICAIIKDEHRFLEEWIEWHLGIGFDAIHLFEDKGSKSHEEICAKYSNVYLRRYDTDNNVQYILRHQESSERQTDLYNWFGDRYNSVYDWVAFIDADEFIMFSDNYDLNKLCDEFEPYPAVLLNWRMMGASGHIKRPTCGVMEAYTIEEEPVEMDKLYLWKSFCNLSRWKGIKKVHDGVGAVNTNHNENTAEWHYNKAWINHYFTKSWEDWCDRIYNRGGTVAGHRRLADFFELNKSMEYLKDSLIGEVIEKIPKGTYWIDRNGTIAGGNVKKIALLNRNNKKL